MGRFVMEVHLRDKSGIRLYRFLVEDVDRYGNIRIYFRRKGKPKIRLRETPGTDAFDKEYQRAFRSELIPPSANQRSVAVPGTMRWLCEQYFVSAPFQLLAPSTRKRARDRRPTVPSCRSDGGPHSGARRLRSMPGCRLGWCRVRR
jgi:hypothetical protein